MDMENYLKEALERYIRNNSEENLLFYFNCICSKYKHLLDATAAETEDCSNTCQKEAGLAFRDSMVPHIESVLSSADLTAPHGLNQAQTIISSLIVFSRNVDNIPSVSSNDIVPHLLVLASSLLQQCKSQTSPPLVTSFIRSVLRFLEQIYDPYKIWRTQYDNYNVNFSKFHFGSALLHAEMVPFLCQSLSVMFDRLPPSLQMDFLHLYGAILSGSQPNAIKSISLPTLDTISLLLQDPSLPQEVRGLSLRLLSHAIALLRALPPEKRPLEMATALDVFLRTFLKLASSPSTEPGWLKAVIEGLNSTLRSEKERVLRRLFHEIGYCSSLLDHLKYSDIPNGPQIVLAIISYLSLYIGSGEQSKKHFVLVDGFSRVFQTVPSLGTIGPDIAQALVDMASQDAGAVQNPEIVVFLIRHLGTIVEPEHALERLLPLVARSQISCCQAGLLQAVLAVLPTASRSCLSLLLKMAEVLLMTSVTSQELKELFLILRVSEEDVLPPFTLPMISVLTKVARKKHTGASHLLDFQTVQDGIVVGELKRWSGPGFTFAAWLRLEPHGLRPSPTQKFYRRQLYSVLTAQGLGFEAFFNEADGELVVATATRREYHAAVVKDITNTSDWHCLVISHTAARKPFSQSQTMVYVNGRQIFATHLKLPPLIEPFVHCAVGCAGQPQPGGEQPTPPDSSTQSLGMVNYLSGMAATHLSGLFDRQRLSKIPGSSLILHSSSTADPLVQSCPLGTQEGSWGLPGPLRGQLATVGLFSDGLSGSQIKAFYTAGPNNLLINKMDELPEMADLHSKMVFYFDAKAFHNNVLIDLAPHHHYEGHVTGTVASLSRFHDVLNTVGGLQALYPLLEFAGRRMLPGEHPHSPLRDSVDPAPTSPTEEDWVMLSRPSLSESRVSQNPVAGVLLLVLHVCQGCPDNQDQLLERQGLPILGLLLQRVSPQFIDVNVLMAVQLLVDSLATLEKSSDLLATLYHHILFDFRIWSKGNFALKIGHIQYVSTLIKDNPKAFRKHYGIQFFLDTLQIYYSNCDLLTFDDLRMIRISLLGLVKFYLSKDVSYGEMAGLVSFLVATTQEQMVLEMLDMLTTLLESSPAKDQFYLLIFEPGCAELLYGILLNKEFAADKARGKVLKLIHLLLKTDRVYEKGKARLRLHEIGGLPGLLAFLPQAPDFVAQLMDLTLLTDTAPAYQGALSILLAVPCTNLGLKLDILEKLWQSMQSRPGSAGVIAKQPGWQESLLSALVKCPNTPVGAGGSSPASLDLIDFSADDGRTEPTEGGGMVSSLRRRSSQRRSAAQRASLYSQSSQEDSSSPRMLLHQLKGHIMDLGIPGISSRSGSRVSSLEDLTATLEEKLPAALSSLLPSGSTQPPLLAAGPAPTDPEARLCHLVTEIAFNVMWCGIEGSSKQAWAERSQVFAYINWLSLSNQLHQPHLEVQRSILERILHVCIQQLQDSGQANATLTENAFELMRLVYYFVMLEDAKDEGRLSSKLLEGVLGLLEVLLVFADSPDGEGWAAMAEMGLAVVLNCASSHNLELCAMATAKLHSLVQTRPQAPLPESCHLLASLDTILSRTIETKDSEHYSFLVPVLRALLERLWTPLHLSRQLPSLPHLSAGPSFFDDFQSYATSSEWRYFLRKVVKPYQLRYITLKPKELKEEMSHFWVACLEANMVASHRRGRSQGESKLRFQAQILDVLDEKVAEEHARLQDVFQSAKCQNIYLRRRWKVVKLHLTGPRGPWQSRDAQHQHWKLAHYENFCRMRLKMVLNTNFDPHLHASRLRDNQDSAGLAPQMPKEALPVKVAREALVWEHNDDYLADEDLQFIFVSSNLEAMDMSTSREKAVMSEDCQLVTLMSVIKGHLEITTSAIYFFDQSPVKEERDRYDFKYGLNQLREVHLRRYNLRRSALEFFLLDQTSFFLNFTPAKRNKVYSRLLSLRPPNLIYTTGLRSPADLMRASGLTAKWVNHDISTFQYLMCLNTIAGRTYNDLSQYPVFPWVLADYTSQELDLDSPDTFRDLSKPIGVVNPKNIPEVRAKYENFVDITGSIPKFHYGTHYSNSAGVLHYLVRVEPFTSLHVELQSGRFDVADRQFHSLEATWRLLMESPYDVKELIPEFFYLPEILINENGFDLGKLQGTLERVDHVKLPPWAESAEDFIYKHRQALESEYVSTNLNHWIDLIFGYKQKGSQAVDALNVFYYVSYEGAVDLDVIQNPLERDATEGMINNFGQTPTQLFKEPHPARLPQAEALAKMCQDHKPPSIFLMMEKLKASFVEVGGGGVVFVSVPRTSRSPGIILPLATQAPDTLVTVSQSGALGLHSWLPFATRQPGHFTFDRDTSLDNPRVTRYIGGPFHPAHQVTSAMFGLTGDGRHLVCGGHWDNSLQVLSLPRPRVVAHVIRHHGVVTCVGLDTANGSRLLSGSEDTTCVVWEVLTGSGGAVSLRHLHTLYGHDQPLSALALSLSLDLALTASWDGTLNMHSVRDGMFLRTLSPPGHGPHPVTLVSVSELGYVAAHCTSAGFSSLHVYTVNGRHLCQRDLPSPLQGLAASGEHLVTGALDGTLALWQTFGLASKNSICLHIPIQTVTLTANNSHVLASLTDGKLIVISADVTAP